MERIVITRKHQRAMQASPNTRLRPLYFECLDSALEYSSTTRNKVWAKVAGWVGVVEVYPGGRNVWHKDG